MKKALIGKDEEGVKYKFPNRSCKQCRRFPCFEGIEICKCDFARYGCRQYLE